MRQMLKPLPENPELAELLKKAGAAYKAMTPEQKKAMLDAQRKSWVVGEMMLGRPDMTREYAERIYEDIR